MFSQKLILPLCKLRLSSRRIAPCCHGRSLRHCLPGRARAQSRQLRLLRSFWRRKLDPAQLHLQLQPGHTPAPLPSAALLDNIHIFLSESASAAASATKSEEGHTGNAEFPRFGQTKSLLSFTSVDLRRSCLLPATLRPCYSNLLHNLEIPK